MKMNDTYGVIKAISKKKYKDHPEKLVELKEGLLKAWKTKIPDTKNFETVWKIIEDSAFYAFNSPHAYSMGGDSAYKSWFKANYTMIFYEVAINHYQEKEKKKKIDALIKECIKFYGLKLGGYKFGKDNRKVTIDNKEMIIYPNLSSVKNFGEKVACEIYEIGKIKYDNFIEVLSAISNTSINASRVEDLIKIDYFSEFGDVNRLLDIKKYYELIYNAKVLKKSKIAENNLDEKIIAKYGHETASQYNQLDNIKILNELIENIEYNPLSIKEKLDIEKDILGIITTKAPLISKRIYYVSELEVLKSIVNVKLYEVYTGLTREVKIWTSAYNKKPFNEKDVLYIATLEKKNKKEPTGEINPDTGKKVYVDIPDKFEFWLSKYFIKQSIEEKSDEELLYR
jgi:DNA polymerase-3 subunit alpha